MMRERHLGRLGETTLEQWCAQVGISANRAHEDRTGWDFLLEFPRVHAAASMPLDKAHEPWQCLVQVKATDGARKSRAVKLSNWLRLTKTPLPSFFLILEFDGGNSCTAAYLVHLDKAWVEVVLR